MRDPRIEPKENDRLYARNFEKFLIVDFVKEDYIYYRVFSKDKFIAAKKCLPEKFKRMAIEQCRKCKRGELQDEKS